MIISKTGYGYNDLTLVPAKLTTIEHRSEINVMVDEKDKLPIFTAPMTTIVSVDNLQDFITNGITPIVPRGMFSHANNKITEEEDYQKRIELLLQNYWVSFSLKETQQLITTLLTNYNELKTFYETEGNELKICIDVANGHMQSIYDTAYNLKSLLFDNDMRIQIMTGNIANPQTFEYVKNNIVQYKHDYYNVIDYIRVGIGGGSGCITSPQTSVHYAQATLIDNCASLKNDGPTNHGTKIIADGGIRNYGDVIKALALGADYVMIGGLFGSTIESSGTKYGDIDGNGVPTYMLSTMELKKYKSHGYFYANGKNICCNNVYTEFYGMASKKGQKDMFGKKRKTAEGKSKFIKVTTTLPQWTENMIAYLKSAMSYCNCRNLNEFIGNQELLPTAIGEMNAVNK